MQETVGFIEIVGLAGAIQGADAALKAANVRLVGYEMSRGGGWVTIKLLGPVAAVQTAIAAGVAAVMASGGTVHHQLVIPRPASALAPILYSSDTVPTPAGESAQSPGHATATEVPPEGVAETMALEPVERDGSDITAFSMEPEPETRESTETSGEGPEDNTMEPPPAEEICNLCGDPLCVRRKGEPRTNCIHFENL